jgi:hypothetical protein
VRGGWAGDERCRGLGEMKWEVDWRCFRASRAFIERNPSNADRLPFPEIRGFYYPPVPSSEVETCQRCSLSDAAACLID